jgi:non-specific serine/threonine protein kinase
VAFAVGAVLMVDRAQTPAAAALPTPRTRLIGREAERATARALLIDDAVPLLTLTGPGGSGKTRLALAIAHDVSDRFADGVTWADLGPLAEPSLVAATVAQAIGIVPMAGLPLEEQLLRELRPRQTLLLLDNCEHLLDAVTHVAASVLLVCPAVQILATSRAPLRCRGEQELPVEPLPLPAADARADELTANEAVRLFAERAHAVDPGFDLNEANAKTAAAICRCLDGLPLAIEPAAARVKVLSLEALLALMDDRLRLLRDGPRDLPARQQTLRDTIAWSYALLESGQQALFRRLSVFVGGWQVDAATAVAGADRSSVHDVLDEIGALVDHSLVRRVEGGGDRRFTMLETIREFGLAELAATGEEDDVRRRHAAWCRELVEALGIHRTMQRDAARMGSLVPEQDNVRQALAWFSAHGDDQSLNTMSAAMSIFWPSLGQFAEARKWLDEAIARDTEVALSIRARVLHEAGWLAMCQGDLDVARPLHDQGLTLAREAGEPYLLAEIILSGGTLAFWQGDLERATTLLEEGQRAFQALAPEYAAASVKAGAAAIILGNIAFVSGDLPLSTTRSEEAVAIARAFDATAELGYALGGLGYARLFDGAVPEAARCFLEATALAWTTRDDGFLARLLWAMAAVATTIAKPDIAARLIGAADALDARTGGALWPADQVIVRWCLSRLASTHDDAALAELRRAGATLGIEQAVAAGRAVAALVLGADHTGAIWRATGAPDLGGDVGEPTLAWPDASHDCNSASTDEVLTQREHEVLDLLCARLTDREIAERLVISTRAVEIHVANVLAKLGVASRRDAAAVAARGFNDGFGQAAISVSPFRRAGDGALGQRLTPREMDVLHELIAGRSDREIAETLFISRRTVSKHVEGILAKLEVRSRGAAVAQARRLGLVASLASGQVH